MDEISSQNTELRALAEQLLHGELGARREAAQRLMAAGSDAAVAACALVQAAGDSDEEIATAAAEALENLGTPPANDVAELAALLSSNASDTCYWAATLLGRLGKASEPAVPALIRTLETHSDLPVRERAVWALGKIGPAARAATQAIERAAASEQPRLARLAQEALRLVTSE